MWGATSQGHSTTFLTQAAKSEICLMCKDTELTATSDSLRQLQMLKGSNWIGWKLWFPPQNPIYRICCLKTPFFYNYIRQKHAKYSAAHNKFLSCSTKGTCEATPAPSSTVMAQPGKLQLPLLWHWSPPGCCGKPRAPLCARATPGQGSQQGAALTPGTTREWILFKGRHVLLHSYTTSVPQRKAPSQNKYAAPQAQQVHHGWCTIVKVLKWNRGEINLFWKYIN